MSSDGLVVDKALVVTHPHEKFDHGVVGEDFVGYAEQFEGDTYVVPFDGIRQCERPYGDASSYDNILNEVGSGKLHEDDAEFLAENYGKVVLAGGYARECLSNTHSSLSGKDVELEIEPSLTYDQSGSNTKGFTMEKVISTGDREIIEKFLGQFEDGHTSLAKGL